LLLLLGLPHPEGHLALGTVHHARLIPSMYLKTPLLPDTFNHPYPYSPLCYFYQIF
jgi:hypothetical protein